MNPRIRSRPLESWVLLNPPPESVMLVREPTPKLRPRDIIFTLLAWLVISALVSLTVIGQAFREKLEQAGGGQDKTRAALEKVSGNFEGRYVVGVKSMGLMQGTTALAQLKSLTQGTLEDRLRYAIFAGELIGPEKATEALDDLQKTITKENIKLKADERKLVPILQHLYKDYEGARFDAPSVSASEKELVREQLGWAGKLALAPAGAEPPENIGAPVGAPMGAVLSKTSIPNPEERADVLAPARTVFLSLMGFISVIGFAGVAGFVGLIVCLVLYMEGKVRSHLLMKPGNGGIYAETFAVWMVVFLALSVGAQFIHIGVPPLLLSAAGFMLSLSALLWPVLRGIPFKTVRQEIGLTFGRHPWRQILLGPACYALTLPLAFIGVLMTLGLMVLQKQLLSGGSGEGGIMSPESGPTHPIVGYIAGAGWWQRLQIVLVASVAAPIVEETFFRGVLYRHLRGASSGLGFALSVVFSSIFASFIFAVIHPQGILALPALMSLAIGFSLMREWRGSLVPSMIAHGINNGLLMCLGFVIFG